MVAQHTLSGLKATLKQKLESGQDGKLCVAYILPQFKPVVYTDFRHFFLWLSLLQDHSSPRHASRVIS